MGNYHKNNHNIGCSKCLKEFATSSFESKTDFSEYDTNWEPRTNDIHRLHANSALNASCKTQLQQVVRDTGARYSALYQLPYYDAVRFLVIDPMHCLFLGIAKHCLTLWKQEGLLSDKDFRLLQIRVDAVVPPPEIGRIPSKVATGFSGFSADQWKNWVCYYSLFALKGIPPSRHYDLWSHYVSACRYMCSRSISPEQCANAEKELLEFCKGFQSIYGAERCTPNMHLSCHLGDCVKDYGPVYGFWCFSFERFNGIMGNYHKNNHNIDGESRPAKVQRFIRHDVIFKNSNDGKRRRRTNDVAVEWFNSHPERHSRYPAPLEVWSTDTSCRAYVFFTDIKAQCILVRYKVKFNHDRKGRGSPPFPGKHARDNLVPDIARVDYLAGNLGRTHLRPLEGLPTFIDDVYVFGYLRREDCVVHGGRLSCTTGEGGAAKNTIHRISAAVYESLGKAPENTARGHIQTSIVHTIAVPERTEGSAIRETIARIEFDTDKKALAKCQELYPETEPAGLFLAKVGFREQGDLAAAMRADTLMILAKTDSVGKHVCTLVRTSDAGYTVRTKLYNKVVSNFEAGEVREPIGGHLADYVDCPNKHLGQTFRHPDVQARGCIRHEVSLRLQRPLGRQCYRGGGRSLGPGIPPLRGPATGQAVVDPGRMPRPVTCAGRPTRGLDLCGLATVSWVWRSTKCHAVGKYSPPSTCTRRPKSQRDAPYPRSRPGTAKGVSWRSGTWQTPRSGSVALGLDSKQSSDTTKSNSDTVPKSWLLAELAGAHKRYAERSQETARTSKKLRCRRDRKGCRCGGAEMDFPGFPPEGGRARAIPQTPARCVASSTCAAEGWGPRARRGHKGCMDDEGPRDHSRRVRRPLRVELPEQIQENDIQAFAHRRWQARGAGDRDPTRVFQSRDGRQISWNPIRVVAAPDPRRLATMQALAAKAQENQATEAAHQETKPKDTTKATWCQANTSLGNTPRRPSAPSSSSFLHERTESPRPTWKSRHTDTSSKERWRRWAESRRCERRMPPALQPGRGADDAAKEEGPLGDVASDCRRLDLPRLVETRPRRARQAGKRRIPNQTDTKRRRGLQGPTQTIFRPPPPRCALSTILMGLVLHSNTD
ncbi:predicted protein [Nematostella vectensis]|uniref:Uncharacterized protein n=1 Tax=Nematostella vectensis TaxID=45351 RepID=A7SYZ9_NEMVE|nr:predicted protein [Nematostella vectensis]|eukprot:XP_001623168.1 predicted protein [Nematostella vectensis]